MKKSISIYLLIIISLFIFTCINTDPDSIQSENYVGGDTNVEWGQVGKEFSVDPKLSGNYYNLNESIEVVNNMDGIVRIMVQLEKLNTPDIQKLLNTLELQELIYMIPPEYFDVYGGMSGDFDLNITSEGIQTYSNIDHVAHTLVKYDCNVGDTYRLSKPDGTTITRTVIAKSDEEDFPYGSENIKTITIEQDSRIPKIKKFIIKANQKYGIVYGEAIMENGLIIGSYINKK